MTATRGPQSEGELRDGHRIVVVVPCYNEAARFSAGGFAPLFDEPDLGVIVVDDGSTDATFDVVGELVGAHPGRVLALRRPTNAGKAAAVATGIDRAMGAGATWVGYLDADLSTPASELVRLTTFCSDDVDGVLASRVRMLGRSIERSPYRHLIGRTFATYVSILLRLGVYDTQCGAKLFRVTPALRAAFAEPFATTWLFDAELVGRLLYPPPDVPAVDRERLVEVPLNAWRDVPGGALSVASAIGIGRELIRLTRTLRPRSAGAGVSSDTAARR